MILQVHGEKRIEACLVYIYILFSVDILYIFSILKSIISNFLLIRFQV